MASLNFSSWRPKLRKSAFCFGFINGTPTSENKRQLPYSNIRPNFVFDYEIGLFIDIGSFCVGLPNII